MSSNLSNDSWQFFHPSYNQFYDLDFQELKDADIRFSKYGWLLMSRDELTLFFFNPFTREIIDLPSSTSPFLSLCFTNPPTSSECTIFGIFEDYDTRFGLIGIGDKEWKSELFESSGGYNRNSPCPPIYYKGVYLCLQYASTEVCVFDPRDKDDWQWMEYELYTEMFRGNEVIDEGSGEEDEKDDKEEENEEDDGGNDEEEVDGEEEEELIHESYMAEVDGDIWGVFVSGDDRRVTVKKLDSLEMRWVELETLGNKCMYVSPNGSFAETCTVNGLANTIYFNKFHNRSGVVYSLQTRMYHSIVGGFASKEAYGLTEVDFGAWVKQKIENVTY